MRLLIVTTEDDMLRDFLLPYARHFRRRGWQVDGLARRDSTYEECVSSFDHLWEVNWSLNPLTPRAFFRNLRSVREIVERERYNIVHIHTPTAGFLVRFALRGLRGQSAVTVVYTAHGFHFHRGNSLLMNAPFLLMEKLAGRWTDFLVLINREDEEAALRYQLVPPGRVRYMPGIGLDRAYYDAEAIAEADIARVREECGLKPGDILFLMIAQFTSNKNQDDAVRALALAGRPNMHLAFAGNGERMSFVQSVANRLNVSHRLHFLGYRRDVPALVRAARATLLVSGREGLPRCVIESLNLGTPVIGTDIRGVRELLANGAGILVPVGNVEEIARAMIWMADHAGEAEAMGRLAQERMATYDLRRLIALHESLYALAEHTSRSTDTILQGS